MSISLPTSPTIQKRTGITVYQVGVSLHDLPVNNGLAALFFFKYI